MVLNWHLHNNACDVGAVTKFGERVVVAGGNSPDSLEMRATQIKKKCPDTIIK